MHCCCFNIFTSYNIIFSIHFDRFFPAPYSMSNRMITQTSMSPYMSTLSTYQVWILFLLINMHFKTYVCKIHEHCNRNMWFSFKNICKTCVFEIWNSFWGGGFGDVGQVCDKCRYSLLCLISGNSICSESDCLQSVFVDVPDAEPILDASSTLHHAAPSKNWSSPYFVLLFLF